MFRAPRCCLVAATFAFAARAPAHEGHAPPSGATFDLSAPRHVAPETARLIGLETVEVDFGSVDEILPLLGIVRAAPDRQQSVVTRLAGTVVAMHKQVGDTVRKGELLAELDSIELVRDLMELEELQSDHERLLGEMNQAESRIVDMQVLARAAAEHASLVEEELKRLQSTPDAVAANVVSAKLAEAMQARTEQRRREIDLSLARRLFTSLDAQVASKVRGITIMRGLCTLAGYEWSDPATGTVSGTPLMRLRAGIDGVVTARFANPGQGLEAKKPLLEIADFSTVQVEGELPESLAARLGPAPMNAVRISIAGDPPRAATGVVRFISPTVDLVKRTAHLLIEAENAGGVLRPGMYVDLAVVLRANPEAVVVPREAVLRDGPVHFVFVQEGDAFVKHDVKPGASDDRLTEIIEGLAPGDVVAARGAYHLVNMRAAGAGGAADAHDGHGHSH